MDENRQISPTQPPNNQSVPPINITVSSDHSTPAAVAGGSETRSEQTSNLVANGQDQVLPTPVVKVYSVRGVEYAMLTIVLWINGVSILWILLALVNGGAKFSILNVPLSMAIVGVPVFAYLFLRLKKEELADPSLKMEPSKRRWTQITQIFAFVATIINLIAFVYVVIARFAGQIHYSMVKIVLDAIIILAVTGGVLAYYWHDEHKQSR